MNVSSFEEGLGRVMYVAGALEYERPLPWPTLSIHVTASQMFGTTRTGIPKVLPVAPCVSARNQQAPLVRDRDALVGDCPKSRRSGERGQDRNRRLGSSEEFLRRLGSSALALVQLQALRSEWPWIFEKGDKPSLIISLSPSSSASNCSSVTPREVGGPRSKWSRRGPTNAGTDRH